MVTWRTLCLAAVPLLPPACASLAQADGVPLPAGIYNFSGSGQGTNYYRDGQQSFLIQVNGTLRVEEDGAYDMLSNYGSCSREGRSGRARPVITVSCGRISLTLSGESGMATVRVTEMYEVRDGCMTWEVNAQGQRTNRCLEWHWRERGRQVARQIPISVSYQSF
jgi:hypothetical protein